jgi:hypothetical protein
VFYEMGRIYRISEKVLDFKEEIAPSTLCLLGRLVGWLVGWLGGWLLVWLLG